MASGSRMCRVEPSLLTILAFSFLISLAGGDPLEVMSAPNLLRVGAAENIFIEIQDCTHENDVNVGITVKTYPTKTRLLGSTSVTLNKTNKYQALGRITIPAEHFSKDPKIKQYVYLQAQFPNRELEKVVLVSFQSGYIFIQTDKTIYTPSSTVLYRLFAVRPGMEPVEKDDQTDTSVTIDIVTPDNIIVESSIILMKSGIHSASYRLAEIVSTGLWKVVAKFQSHLQQSFVAEFEVKEYVLPSFEVKLTSAIPFFYVDSEELDINIKARYLFGEEVDGTAYVVFGIVHEGHKKSLSSSLQRVPIVRSNGVAKLKKQHITHTFPNILDLEGGSIYVSVSVLTESGSEMVEAELRGIQIVKSPYTIHFKKTRQYFRPGISFDVAIEVLNPDGSPAKDVRVMVVEPDEVEGVTAANGMARLSINTEEVFAPLIIQAKTNVPGILPERQALAQMTALPFTSRSNNYIHIGVDTAEVKLGENLKINLNLNRQYNEENDITYLILSRGQLVKHGRFRIRRQILISLTIVITKEMLPSFRIVAYYHPNSGEVVSDSIWVDVEDSCMGSLKLEQSKPENSYEPRNTFRLKITGDPHARVGLVAVDKGIYVLNNKYRLTQKKIWDVVEKYDTGCTPGGGKDSMNVFFDAGLMIETNTASGTPDRIDSSCNASRSSSSSSRRKRATTIMEVRTSLASQYEDKDESECCLDGMRDVPVSYSCERRSEYILDGLACVKAFLNCCKEMEKQQNERKEDALQLARSEVDDSYMDSDQIVTRTNFPESWYWYEYELTSCSPVTPHCDTMVLEQNVPLPDSITTWQFTGISMSTTHGICVADPLEIIVRKKFFIDLRLPYSAVRGEQLEVKAVLHNYSPEPITVRVDLKEETNLCSAAYKRGRFRQEVEVGAQTTRAVPFIIIPMRNGKFPIEVKAAVRDSFLNDGIRKNLLVVPEGVLIKHPTNLELDPARKGVDGRQEEIINSRIPAVDLVPDTPMSTIISLTGREQMSDLFDNAISGKSMGTLIRQPSGCGEQNMIGMTLPVIAAVYLDKTNQWDTVGFKRRNDALQHIKTGYTRELTFRKDDGSFAVYPHSKSSTWLTAYVAKVFSMAYNLVAVQTNVICDAIKFLILRAKQPDGMFAELGRVYSQGMIGDVQGSDSDASMTAFCLITLQESRTICSSTVHSLPSSINRAVSYLERRLPSITNPYAVAMTSYALANENKLNKGILFKFASSDRSHWPVSKGYVLTLEATAYALLALVKAGVSAYKTCQTDQCRMKAFEEAKPIVRWLSKQQKVYGGYGSTQATIMVYQAVAEYWTSAKEPDYDLNVDLLIPGRSLIDRYNFNTNNHHSTRTSKFNGINKDIKVTANGTGEAMFRMVSLYYALPKEKESDCELFDLNVKLEPVKMGEEERIYKLTIEVMFKNKERNTTMSILDVGLPTGFTFNKDDLDRLSKGRARTIANYEMDKVLSERGSLIIYLDKITNVHSEEISFRIHQEMKVGILQPAAVSVYEYNDKRHCVKFYHPGRISGELLKLCTDKECTCAEENCSMQKKEQISNDERTAKACETTDTGKIDFVYKVGVEDIKDGLSTDIYTVRVLEVIKEGTTDVGPQNQLRTFLSYQHCREALDLKKNQTYLIMGTSKDISTASITGSDGQHRLFQYVLGERTWIEYWPTVAECQTDQYRPTCLGIEELVLQYTIFGCQQK